MQRWLRGIERRRDLHQRFAQLAKLDNTLAVLRAIGRWASENVACGFVAHFFFAVLADCLNALAVGAPFVPGLRMASSEPALILARLAAIFA